MARAGEDAKSSGRRSPFCRQQISATSQKYDEEMDRLFKRFQKLREPDPDHFETERLSGPPIFTLWDTQQKVVRLQGNNLVASPAASNISPAKIKVMPNQVVQAQHPIFLGVGDRSLSCGTSEEPALQLENRPINSVYNENSKNLPYTFIKRKTGNTHQFESLAYPGWFLCTSQGNNEALSITNHPGEKQITTFYFKKG